MAVLAISDDALLDLVSRERLLTNLGVLLVARTRIANAQLRQQACKSAASCALNTAEGAARQTLADKSWTYAIALAEGCEACAAVEIAGALGACSAADVLAGLELGTRVKNVLSRLVRQALPPHTTRKASRSHPFIEHNPRGPLVVAILRRIAYTILTLFRSSLSAPTSVDTSRGRT